MSITTMCAGYPDTPHQVDDPGLLNGYGMCAACGQAMRKDAIERRAEAERIANRTQVAWAVELTQRMPWDTYVTITSWHETEREARETIWGDLLYKSRYANSSVQGQVWAVVRFERAS